MTTTREAALEAALTLARNRLQACAIDHPTGSLEMYERSEWADEATAALSTPATEPQGLVENDTIDSLCLTLRRLVSDAYAERDRFGHIAATIRVNALHYGATNAEVEAMLSGEISFVNWIADKVEARPAPQPAADTRVVPVWQLERWRAYAEDGLVSTPIKEIRAIIGIAAPAPSDKIAEAARVLLDGYHNLGGTGVVYCAFDDASVYPPDAEVALRALAGQGVTP